MATKSRDIIKGLSKDKLKSLIFYLTQRYYETFKSNDVQGFDRAVEQLFFIVEEYADKYANLEGFICFCLYLNANVEVSAGHEAQAFSLHPLFKMDLREDNVEELAFDIKNIFNKERIRERYNEKRTREHVE